jgi:hypothetical protein
VAAFARGTVSYGQSYCFFLRERASRTRGRQAVCAPLMAETSANANAVVAKSSIASSRVNAELRTASCFAWFEKCVQETGRLSPSRRVGMPASKFCSMSSSEQFLVSGTVK